MKADNTSWAVDAQSIPQKYIDCFWAKIIKTDTCWIFDAARTDKGYGRQMISKHPYKVVLAHRLMYALTKGPVPAGISVCHKCPGDRHNPMCVNPDHLYLGDNADNARDQAIHHQKPKSTKLTDEQIAEIRRRVPFTTQKALAQEFGISKAHMNRIVHGRRRKTYPLAGGVASPASD